MSAKFSAPTLSNLLRVVHNTSQVNIKDYNNTILPQRFLGVSGNIFSYNFQGGIHLANQVLKEITLT